jgi:hypothetical protein
MAAIYDEYKDKDNGAAQANAICYAQWRDHKTIDTGAGLVAYDLQGQKKEKAAIGNGTMRLFGQIQKIEPLDDGTIKVHGIVSTPAKDDQGEIVLPAAMREAIPDYMRFPALREMHGLSAAGTALSCDCDDNGITRIVGHVVDPIAVKKVRNNVYRGFSIGGRVIEREAGNYSTISKLQLQEISLVDRPANPEAVISLWKISGENHMPDGLGTMASAFAEAMAKTQQHWRCNNPGHMHFKKEEAASCMVKNGRGVVGDPQAALEGRKAFAAGDRRFGDAEKHGLPDTPEIKPGDPPGDGAGERNFDGDDDSDDREMSAESAGGGFDPGESEEDRREDFGKKDNGDGKKPYGDVAYADPGYQSDGKKRYPIDTEGHVRAAWSYINQADNARQYSSEQLGRIKAKIRAAAGRHGIEISEKAIFDLGDPEALIRSLADVSIGTLLDDLPYDLDGVIEKAGRRQSAADTFLKNVVHDAIGKLTDGEFCRKEAAGNATQDTARNPEHEAPGESTDSGTAHYRLGENATQDTAKRGARHNAATMGFLRKAHDNMCKAGASCPAHDEMMGKAINLEGDNAMGATATTSDEVALELARQDRKENKKLRKTVEGMREQIAVMQTHMEYLSKEAGKAPPPAPPQVPEKEPKLKKTLATFGEQMTAMQARIEQIASAPVPGNASHLPPGIIEISKAQDGSQGQQPTDQQRATAAELAKRWELMSPEEKFAASYAVSRMQPYAQQR